MWLNGRLMSDSELMLDSDAPYRDIAVDAAPADVAIASPEVTPYMAGDGGLRRSDHARAR